MEKKDILISVILPIFNVEKYLSKCLDSIIKQSYKNIQIILVDDGATDRSGKICDKYKSQDNRILVLHKENGGLVSAWKLGLSKAQGEYICFIDPDDYIEKDYITSLVKAMQKYEVPFVIAPTYELRDKKVFLKLRLSPGVYFGIKLKKLKNKYLLNDGHFQDRLIPPSRWGKLIKKSLIEENLKYTDIRMTYGEDLSIIVPILLSINKMYVESKANNGYVSRIRSDSMVRGYDTNRWNSVKLVYSNLLLAFKDKGATAQMYNQLSIDYFTALIEAYKNEVKNDKSNAQDLLNLIYKMHEQPLFRESLPLMRQRNFNWINNLFLFNIYKGNKILNYVLYKLMRVAYIIKRGQN